MTNTNISDTGAGVLVGADPAQPRTVADWGTQPRPDQAVTQQPSPPQQPQQPPQPQGRTFTEEELEAARRQEKEKLYPRLEELDTQLKSVLAEREAEKAERERLAAEAEEARKAREEGEMEVRDLLNKREQEWSQRFEEINQRYDTDRALFERERALQEAELYRRDRIAQESPHILPQLLGRVSGSTIEEIDASIEELKAITDSVMQDFAAATEQAPPAPFQPRGASPTAPPVGPMEQLPEYQNLTAEDIRGMDMATFKKHRESLLRAASAQKRIG
jgi:hypothetical protein